MHPLRVLLLVSLVVAAAVAWGLGAALQQAGVEHTGAVGLSVAAFLAFLVPWAGVSVWTVRRARDLELLTELARRPPDASDRAPGKDRLYHAELDDLARGIEELRGTIVRIRGAHEEHRAAMDEIVSSLGEGLLAINRRGTIVVANSRVAEMFGVGDEIVGRSAIEVVRRQPIVAALDRALRGEPSIDRLTVGSGAAERQIEIRAVPVESSPEIAAVALFIDVTTLELLQRVRRDFLDDFSHEVRTPLAGLKSAAETLDGKDLPPDHEVKLRQVMQRQISRIERLVTDLAELNHIETGQIVLHRKPVPLLALLEDLCLEFQGRVPHLKFDIQGDDLSVSADAPRIQQVFSNLLDNAIRHGGDGGEVTVRVKREESEALVTVSDRGPGIPPDEVERVFNRFYRIDRSRSRPGTGLGLAIAKHLVVLHGGSIRACSQAGGATFEVRLPFP